MKFKHFILSLLFLLTGRFAAAASDSLSYEALSDSLLQDVIRQFEVIHRYNTRNDELGRSDKNIYMITFQPGQEIYADANNILYFNVFNESPAGGHPSLVSENFKNEMNARLVEFNGMQPSQRRAVTMYGFILENYYLDVDSDFLRSYRGNVDLAAYWKKELEATTEAKRKAIIERNKTEHQTKIKDRLDQLIKNKLSEINVLVHSIAYWSSTKWALPQAPQSRQNYWVTIHGWNSNSEFVINNSEARELYRSSMRSSRVYPVFADRDERYIFHNIVSEIEFLTNPDIVAQFNRPCGEQLHIWRDHPMVSDPAHPYYARIQENPCLLKTIILQTDIPTDEHSRFEAKGCHIVFKNSWLLETTAPRKLSDWQNKVTEAKTQLSALIQSPNSYVYAPVLNEKSREVLNDKLIAYSQFVPGKKIYFLHLSLPFFLTDEEKQTFADAVATASGFDAGSMTLFVVPYFAHIYLRSAHCSNAVENVRPIYYYFPAVAGYDAAGIRAAMQPNDMVFNLETDYGIPLGDPGFYASCLNLYKRVNKPYFLVKCFIRRSGHIEMIADRPTFPLPSELTNNTYLTNLTLSREHKAIVDYRIYYDSIGIKHINSAHSLRMAQHNACNNTPCLEQATAYYYESVRQILSSSFDIEATDFQFFTNPRLRESYALRQDAVTGLYYIDLYCRSLVKKWFPPDMPAPQAVDVSLNAAALFPYQWTQQDVYLIFDIASIALSPFGLDVIPEYLGFCYATLNLDESRMAIYGGAVLAVGALNYAIHGASISARYGSKVSDNSISGTWRWISSAPDVTDALHLRWPQSQVRTLVGSSEVRLSRLKQLMRNDDLLRALDELPDDAVRRAFLEDFLRISPEGAFFAAKLLGKPRLVKAWGGVFLRNVPKQLQLNIPFLTRLSDNPNLINYVEILTDAGKSDLTQNVVIWIKRYDVRKPLKVGNIVEVVEVLNGSIGSPRVYNGINYVDYLSASQVAKFNDIVNSTSDVALISNNLGISENIVQTMKKHLFIDEHIVEVNPGVFIKGRFATFEHIADWWNAVKSGNLANAIELKRLISHEYIEAKLMKEGMIYRTLDDPSASKYGAHELSSHEDLFNFSHWSALGRNVPPMNLHPNLDNIDEIVDQIKNIEGL